MEKVLLLDSNLASYPMYQYLIDANYEVFVAGANENDFLAKYSKNYLNFNYSKYRLLIKNIEKYNIKYIIPGCNDISYFCCAKVNEHLNFSKNIDSYKITELLNNKNSFKKFALENKISVPKLTNNFYDFKSCIIKPVDSYSGKGNTIVCSTNYDEIKIAKKIAIENSKIKKFLVEEYVEGQLYSHSAFLSKGKIAIDFIVKEYCIANKFAVDTSYYCNDFNKNQIRQEIQKIVKNLNLKEGLIHTQFIKNKNSIKILEVTRRCPGDLYNLLIQKSTGFNYAKAYVDPFLNKNFQNIKNKLKKNCIIRHTITSTENLQFKSLKFKKNIDATDLFILNLSGNFLNIAPKSRIGILFSKIKSNKNFNKILNLFLNRKIYKIE